MQEKKIMINFFHGRNMTCLSLSSYYFSDWNIIKIKFKPALQRPNILNLKLERLKLRRMQGAWSLAKSKVKVC
jgi:hypothetical protein